MIDLKILQEHYPFLSLYEFGGVEFIGIIQFQGKNVINIYVYNYIDDPELRKLFLKMGDEWWHESNQKIPINLFLKKDFEIFKPFIQTYTNKEFKLITGHIINFQNLNKKRIKRRRIELIRPISEN